MNLDDFLVSDTARLDRKARDAQEEFTPADIVRLLEVHSSLYEAGSLVSNDCHVRENVSRKLIDVLNGDEFPIGLKEDFNAFHKQYMDTDPMAVQRMHILFEMAACDVGLRSVGWEVVSQRRATALGIERKKLLEKVICEKPTVEKLAAESDFFRRFAVTLSKLASALRNYPYEKEEANT